METERDSQPTVVSAQLEVAAPATAIFELIADPAQHPTWDGNHNVAEAAAGQRVGAVGEVFRATLTKGAVRENHVSAFAEGRLIAWRPASEGEPPAGHEWRWELEPLGDRLTRVRHVYDWSQLRDPSREARARATTPQMLAASIERLAALVES